MSENPRISLSNTYDPLGRRVTKTHTTPNETITHRYLYDGAPQGHFLASSGQNIVAILGANQELLATILHHPDRTDTPLAITNHETNQTYYYHRNHQGSIIALTNQAGQIVERITYDGHFGNIMEHTQHEVTHNPYGYTGREMDTLRLYYYRARYYSPMLHRFLSPDPIEHASGDWNWYRYVGNDPVNRTDPSGLYEGMAGLSGAKTEVIRHATVIGPYDAYQGAKNAEYALKTTNELVKKGVLRNPLNGSADAFRHCLWSCKMTRSIGKNQAKAFLDDHEKWNYEPGVGRDGVSNGASTMMDLNNNFIGQQCAATPRKCKDICLEKALSNKSDLFKIWK